MRAMRHDDAEHSETAAARRLTPRGSAADSEAAGAAVIDAWGLWVRRGDEGGAGRLGGGGLGAGRARRGAARRGAATIEGVLPVCMVPAPAIVEVLCHAPRARPPSATSRHVTPTCSPAACR